MKSKAEPVIQKVCSVVIVLYIISTVYIAVGA